MYYPRKRKEILLLKEKHIWQLQVVNLYKKGADNRALLFF